MPEIETTIVSHAAVEAIRSEAGYIIARCDGDDGPVQTGSGPTLEGCKAIAIEQLHRDPDARIGVFALVSEFTAPRTVNDESNTKQPG